MALGRDLGLDPLPVFVREREELLRRLIADYDTLAAQSREGEPDEDGLALPDRMPLPGELSLPPIDLASLGPDPAEVGRLREALAVPDAEGWWEAALGLGVLGALGGADPELRERLRRREWEFGSIDLAAEELVA